MEYINSELPALPNENLRFYQMISSSVIPYWDTLNPGVSINDVVSKALDKVFTSEPGAKSNIDEIVNTPEVQEMIDDSSMQSIEDELDSDLDDIKKMGNEPIEETIRKLELNKTTRTPKQISELVNQVVHPEPEPEPEPETKTPGVSNPEKENMLTGELIDLCSDVTIRFKWYNDIDFGNVKSIVAKKSLKKKVIKFETQTVDSYMKRFKQIFDLLQHHDFKMSMLSSTEVRTYLDVYEDFEKESDLMEKISLVDEMRLIPASWLPKIAQFSRRKRITPVISGNAKSSADKESS